MSHTHPVNNNSTRFTAPGFTLAGLVDELQARMQAETAVLVLAEEDGLVGHYAEASGKHAAWLRGRRGPSATSGLSGTAFRSSETVLVVETEGDDRVRQDHAQALGIVTALAAALRFEGKLLGAFMLLNKLDGSRYTSTTDVPLLEQYIAEITTDLATYLANQEKTSFGVGNQ